MLLHSAVCHWFSWLYRVYCIIEFSKIYPFYHNGRWGCFLSRTIMTNDTGNILTHNFWCTHVCITIGEWNCWSIKHMCVHLVGPTKMLSEVKGPNLSVGQVSFCCLYPAITFNWKVTWSHHILIITGSDLTASKFHPVFPNFISSLVTESFKAFFSRFPNHIHSTGFDYLHVAFVFPTPICTQACPPPVYQRWCPKPPGHPEHLSSFIHWFQTQPLLQHHVLVTELVLGQKMDKTWRCPEELIVRGNRYENKQAW